MLRQHFFCKNDFFLLKILFYRFRLIINLIERKQALIKKYSEEKRQMVIDAREDGATIAQIATQPELVKQR